MVRWGVFGIVTGIVVGMQHEIFKTTPFSLSLKLEREIKWRESSTGHFGRLREPTEVMRRARSLREMACDVSRNDGTAN